MESILTVGALLQILAVALLASADAGPGFHSFVEGGTSREWSRRRTASVAWRDLPLSRRRRLAPGIPVPSGTMHATEDAAAPAGYCPQPSHDHERVIVAPDATIRTVTPAR